MTGREDTAGQALLGRRRPAEASRRAREQGIVDMLKGGVSMAEIALREGVTRRRMQIILEEILARRGPRAPADCLARRTSRLNEAMSLARDAMGRAISARSAKW